MVFNMADQMAAVHSRSDSNPGFQQLRCEWRARGARSKRVASREQETLKPKHYGIPSRSWRLGGIANYAASGALGARARSEWRLGNKKP